MDISEKILSDPINKWVFTNAGTEVFLVGGYIRDLLLDRASHDKDYVLKNKAKTIADCFKFRNKIGLDIALEALKDSRQIKLCTNDEIWKYAKLCRVSNIMKPYMEAVL